MLGVLFSENLAIKCRDIAQEFGVFTLRTAMHQQEKRYIKVLGKIEKINEYTSKNGNNYLKVKITDGLWDYSFSVWSNSIADFMFQYKEGDIAIIPLQNRGEEDDRPNDRSFNSRGQGKIIERDGIPTDE
jgi:DNA polymerase III alpha subunit